MKTKSADAFVLFGIGSALLVDFLESCKRLGILVRAGVANRDGQHFLPNGLQPTLVQDVSPELLAVACLCPMFTPLNRFIAVTEAEGFGFRFGASLIDPTAIVASDLEIKGGSFVNSGAIVGAATRIEDHVLINRGASIGHHNELESFVSVGPGAILAGHVAVGRGAMIGAGAIVGPGLTIGRYAIVGAGAVVLRDVPSQRRVVGNPAKVINGPLAGFGNEPSIS